MAAFEHTQLREAQTLRRAFPEDYTDRYMMCLPENHRSELRAAEQGNHRPVYGDAPFMNLGYGIQMDSCHEGSTYTRSYIVSLLPEEADTILKHREDLLACYRHAMLNDVNVTRGMILRIDTCLPPQNLSMVMDKDGHYHPAVCVRFLFEDKAAGSASPSPRRTSCLYLPVPPRDKASGAEA